MDIRAANCHQRFHPPIAMQVSMHSGWYFAVLRTSSVAAYYSVIDKRLAGWPQMPLQLSFNLSFVVDGADICVGFDDYSVTLDSKFFWPLVGEFVPVVARITRTRIGGQPACALAELRLGDNAIGRVLHPSIEHE
jgi:hypothetical protein